MLGHNGLRPARYLITNDDTVVIASETGVLPFEASEIKEKLADQFPYRDWLSRNRINLDSISLKSVFSTLFLIPSILLSYFLYIVPLKKCPLYHHTHIRTFTSIDLFCN